MDLQEKQKAAKDWLVQKMEELGFRLTKEEHSPHTSVYWMNFNKPEFPDVEIGTSFSDAALRNTPPRVLMNDVLPQRLSDMTSHYQRLLRDHRLRR